MICIDWKDLGRLKKNAVKDHSSYANLLMSKKNDVETLDNCLKNRITQPYTEEVETFCCNVPLMSEITEKIHKNPETMTVYLFLFSDLPLESY